MRQVDLAGLPEGGRYVLVIELCRTAGRRFGALGRHRLEPGWILYIGSASRGLPRRMKRHLAGRKPLHCDIDYLTSMPQARTRAIVTVPVASGLTECGLNRAIGELSDGSQPIDGFGASDCQENCGAHLWRSESMPDLDRLAELDPEARVLVVPGRP